MESYFKALTLWLASGSEAAAALVIGLATIEATLRALWLFVQGAFPQVGVREHQDDKERVRLRLGRWLAVALEFELAADVLRTAVAPTWDEIGQLAAIVVLRTLLNYFLQKEIDKAEARDALRMSRAARAEGGGVEAIFGSGSDLAWYQECARAALIFVYGLALVRIAGQADIRKMVGARYRRVDHHRVEPQPGADRRRTTLGHARRDDAAGRAALGAGAAGRASPGFSRIIEGSPVELARHGEPSRSALERYAVSQADLNEALRQAGVEDIAAARTVTLEPSGKITVLKGDPPHPAER